MRLLTFTLGIFLTAFLTSASAQWLNYPDSGTPLTPDGKPDLSAKAPRTLDHKPDLSGVWAIEPAAPGEIERLYGSAVANGPQAVAGDDIRQMNKYFLNLFIDFKPGEGPIRPENSRQGGQAPPGRRQPVFPAALFALWNAPALFQRPAL